MKKLLAILLALVMVLSMAACAGNKTSAGGDAETVGSGGGEAMAPETSGVPETTVDTSKPITVTFDEETATIYVTGYGEIQDAINSKYTAGYKYQDKAKRIVVEEGCTRIGNRAFEECTLVEEVIIADSVSCIGAYAFDGCSSLVTLQLPDTLTTIENYAFKNCDALTQVELPRMLSSIDNGAFESCDSLSKVTLYDAIAYIAPYVFKDCPVEYTEHAGIQYLGNSENPYILAVDVADNDQDTYTLADTTVIVGPSCFGGCNNLTQITIPGSVRILSSGAFRNCKKLTAVTLPNGLVTIGDECFKYDGKLTDVALPDTLEVLGMNAFDECYGLTSMVLPVSLVEIGNTAFKYTAIDEMTFGGTLAQWEAIVKGTSGTNATVHCTDGDAEY